MKIDKKLLYKYFSFACDDIMADYDKQIKKAKVDADRAEDWQRIADLIHEKSGAFSAMVCMMRGSLCNGDDETVEERVTEYLKKEIK